MQWPSLSVILSEIFLAYIVYSIYTLSLLFVSPACEDGKPCLESYLSERPQLDLYMYSSIRRNPASRDVDLVYSGQNFAYDQTQTIPVTLTVPGDTRRNGTLFLHILLTPPSVKRSRTFVDLQKDIFTSYTAIKMTQYVVPEAEAFKLLGDKSHGHGTKKVTSQIIVRPVSHVKSRVTFTIMTDNVMLPIYGMPAELVNHIKIIGKRTFLPIVTCDFLQTRHRDLKRITPQNYTTNVAVEYSPVSLGKLRLVLHVQATMENLRNLGFSDKDIDEVKGIFADTNVYLLGGTFFIAAVHLGKGHNMASLVSVSFQMIAMSFLTKGNNDFTSDHLADIAILLSSCNNVISTEVPIALGKIAACIRKSGKANEFSKIETANVMDWLKLNCPPAMEKLEAFFNTHGHRCVHELDLFAEPWVLKPDSIINTIQVLATSIEENYVSKTLSVQETVASLKTPVSPFVKLLLRQIVPFCRTAVTKREMTKNVTVSAVHTLRLAYRRLGALMVAENYIPDEHLIFFLTHQEIGQLLNNHNSLLVRKALRRRKIYQQVAKLEYPEFNTGMPVPIQSTLDVSAYEGCTKIEGTSVCGGSVLGRACVIIDLSEAKNIQHGDILITRCTDIGWSPYFPLLAGIVTELGGLISHGAVVAREYGLPCIVGAKNATQVFQMGDTVLLAGDIGTLQLIEKA
ncbi:Uncharacterized protein DBV15_06257 [Temnothorax longispinosus]|uniref:PEP-utilising enzyme mobile domain-containing protein n=1 Tax=Temnothorax longispinosus TaxID=300112 RepID=A0A4S2KVZ6_9HYME|nr:Uncharacterized protein DBV15_06257 [Temnothorax longispinosus]